METKEYAPCTENEADLILSEELESLWYTIKGNRSEAVDQIAKACQEYHVTSARLREIIHALAEERVGKEDYLPRMHVIIHRISQGATKTGAWDRWNLIPDCPFCEGGLAYAARYEDGLLAGGNYVICQCEKGDKHPQKNLLHYHLSEDVVKIEGVKLIPKNSQEFMDDVRKIVSNEQVIKWLDRYGENPDIKDHLIPF